MSLQVVREDHFRKVPLERPFDGPIVVSSPFKHVWYHSGGCWSTSVSEVYCDHILHVCLTAHVLLSDDGPRPGHVNHILSAHCAAHLAFPSSVSLVLRLGRLARLACMDRAIGRMLLMVLLRPQVVRKNR